MDAQTKAQLESQAYRDTLIDALKHAGPEQMAHLSDRAILAAAVITAEFERRYPAEFEAWNEFGDEHGTADSKV